jgi:hypothetical protein
MIPPETKYTRIGDAFVGYQVLELWEGGDGGGGIAVHIAARPDSWQLYAVRQA